MGGLTRLFIRILPIITLICFICFGISYTFETNQTGSITYLSKEVITLNDNGTQTTTDDLTIEQYKFDMVSYTQNIDQNILKRSLTKSTQIEEYTNTLENFNTIWKDGYQAGDIGNTILNVGILIINTLILPINILLIPIRIISGILLTAFSLLGININKETFIITTLNFLLDKLAIPLIDPTGSEEIAEQLEGSFWLLNAPTEKAGSFKFNYQITLDNNYSFTYFNRLTIAQDQITCRTPEGNTITLYSNNTWHYGTWSRYIYITNNDFNGAKATQIQAFLRKADAIELDESPYPTPTTNLDNTTWTFNNQITFDSNYFDTYTMSFNDGTLTWETLILNTITPNNNNAMVYRRTNQTPYEIIACQELQNTTIWYSQYNLKTITITDTSYLTPSQINNLYNYLITNAMQV